MITLQREFLLILVIQDKVGVQPYNCEQKSYFFTFSLVSNCIVSIVAKESFTLGLTYFSKLNEHSLLESEHDILLG